MAIRLGIRHVFLCLYVKIIRVELLFEENSGDLLRI